ncbi:MAG: histidine phosphatase family protein [Boseongicola sp. SB0676_bin_33]|uniref:Histidine phosphatase family protein n=1 Tax=Boseongicola sp. SB0664_bin_43 TaxID=2604844 RepID=A0A6B0XWM5_9RHOB|nr:histidine phosphatase family protein [Boseongicola sp. SB0664_bin_43]MYF89762.1 histidine phosphatase family protein [Boseongicola sp. SB0676_bin_33]
MTLTLILTRHAKSSWDDPTLDDFDRSLNGRGRKSAPLIGRWLVERGHVPQVVVASGARRTVETWEGMAPAMPESTVLDRDRALFHAGASTILGVLRKQAAARIMLIGHNPGFADFASRVVVRPPGHDRFSDYPTAATAVIDFKVASWAHVRWGSGRVQDFVVPRDLM